MMKLSRPVLYLLTGSVLCGCGRSAPASRFALDPPGAAPCDDVTANGAPFAQTLAPALDHAASSIIPDSFERETWSAYAAEYLSIAASACSDKMRSWQRARGVTVDPEVAAAMRGLYTQLPAHLRMPADAAHDDDAFLDWLHSNARPWRSLEIRRVGDASVFPSRQDGLAYHPGLAYTRQRDPAPGEGAVVLHVRATVVISQAEDLPLDIFVAFEPLADSWVVTKVAARGGDRHLARLLTL